MTRILLLLFVCVAFAGCGDDRTLSKDRAGNILQQEAITDIKLYGDAWSVCPVGFDNRSVFFAGKRNGVSVAGAICGTLSSRLYAIYYEEPR